MYRCGHMAEVDDLFPESIRKYPWNISNPPTERAHLVITFWKGPQDVSSRNLLYDVILSSKTIQETVQWGFPLPTLLSSAIQNCMTEKTNHLYSQEKESKSMWWFGATCFCSASRTLMSTPEIQAYKQSIHRWHFYLQVDFLRKIYWQRVSS